MMRPTPSLWPPTFGAAIFDFDGTLADTASIWHEVDVQFLSRRHLPLTPDYPARMATLGFRDGARYTIERFGLTETVDQICREWSELSRELYTSSVRLRPRATSYIRALLSLDIPCALATTNESSVLSSMEHVDVFELFDACVFGAEVGRGKDYPDIYLEAARRLGVSPDSCMVFEDIEPAVHSAHKAGMLCCGVRANDSRQNIPLMQNICDLWLDDWRSIPLP